MMTKTSTPWRLEVRRQLLWKVERVEKPKAEVVEITVPLRKEKQENLLPIEGRIAA